MKNFWKTYLCKAGIHIYFSEYSGYGLIIRKTCVCCGKTVNGVY